jgi:hypothetical protein
MAGDPKSPVVGEFVFDGSEFNAYAVDLPQGACRGKLTAREGFEEACKELFANQADHGTRAGITADDATHLAAANERIARIDAFLPALLKAAEVLTETRYMLDDKRQQILFNAAQSVDRRGKQHPDLIARYERIREYRSASAKKAVKTRRKNAEQNGAPGEGPGAPPSHLSGAAATS